MPDTITISVGDSRRCTNWKPRDVTWDQLCRKLANPVRTAETMAEYAAMTKDQRADVKDVGGFVGGRIETGHRKAGNITDRQLICLDADFANADLMDTWELMVGCAALVHSSHSSTPEQPRLRLIAPLARPVTAAEYEPIARRLAEWLDIDAFDDTTYEADRLMYWGSCSSDAEYIFKRCESDTWVDPDEVLATYTDWHDMREWPTSSRQPEVIGRMGKVQGDPLTKPGVIGAFNRAYRITEAIEKFIPEVYSPAGAGRWTYNGGTTTGGAVTYDDDTFIYSHHDTDPISRRLCNAYDMVRLHKFGQLDEGSDAAYGQMSSDNAMLALIADDEAVSREFRAGLSAADPNEVFSELPNVIQIFENDLTEQGFSAQFADFSHRYLRHSEQFGWMFWDGVKWKTGANAEAKMLVMQFNDDLYANTREALIRATASGAKEQEAQAKALIKAINGMRRAPSVNHILSFSESILNEPHPELYDANPWELNTPEGIIDLKTGNLLPCAPSARHTKTTACAFGDEGKEMWLRFVDYITGGNQEFASYLQQLLGMAAVGKVYEEGMVLVYGKGSNGKSTFFGAVKRVLGDYAKTINASLLVGTTQGKADQNAIAALRGTRLVVMGETAENAHLATELMKQTASSDTISARPNYQGMVEFTPSHTYIMHTNHLPRLLSMDDGLKRRITVAPFPVTVTPNEVITDYVTVLVERCGPAILKWIIDGAVSFYTAGCRLTKPDYVVRATREYITREDVIGQFLRECCADEPGAETAGQDLYYKYSEWAAQQGFRVPKRANELAQDLERRGYERTHTRTGKKWLNIKIISTAAL